MLSIHAQFPVTFLTGPRQSGKTTLIKSLRLGLPYVSLEDPDMRVFASKDPRGFLNNYKDGMVIDEAQNVPELFSYIQGLVDGSKKKYVLSGSQNFLLMDKINQSLAGRVGILKLLPFQIKEIKLQIKDKSFYELLFTGFYPRIYANSISPSDYYPNYINTYIERDVRQLKNIENLRTFTNFLKLCAGRIGQPLNMASLASDAGISPNTAKSWLSLLEASYIVFFLPPHYKNFSKRIIKSPKLYFYDTGVACSLLGIESPRQLATHFAIGSLFENMIILDLVKRKLNAGKQINFYFWKNNTGKEIDLIVDKADAAIPFEIKSGATMNSSYFSNLFYWQKLTNTSPKNLHVIYGGDKSNKTNMGNLISWRDLDNLKNL